MNTRKYLRGVPVDLLSKSQVLEQMDQWLLGTEQTRQIVTLNALMLIGALRNSELNQIIQSSDLITIDGFGVLKALRKMGCQNPEQFTGIELTREMLSRCAGYHCPVYIYGGSSVVASNLRLILARDWPGLTVAGIRDGYGNTMSQNRICEEIIASQPSLLLVGLGSPDQEFFLANIMPKLIKTIGIGVGGTLDVLAGIKREAPLFLRNHGWEWLYRMLQDPVKLKRFPDLFKFWYWCLR